jgi:CMP-2-keto-3-deoxyoctulosonic acid synthetase
MMDRPACGSPRCSKHAMAIYTVSSDTDAAVKTHRVARVCRKTTGGGVHFSDMRIPNHATERWLHHVQHTYGVRRFILNAFGTPASYKLALRQNLQAHTRAQIALAHTHLMMVNFGAALDTQAGTRCPHRTKESRPTALIHNVSR